MVRTELYIDGLLYATDTAAPYAFSWNTTQSAAGAHALEVRAADAAGNVGRASRTVTVANPVQQHAPVAVNDVFSAPYRANSTYAARVYAVLANDSDADGNLNAASVSITSAPDKGGAVRVNANGTVSYTPKRSFSGTETFRYTVKDRLGATSNTATVTVTVSLRPSAFDRFEDAWDTAAHRPRGPRRSARPPREVVSGVDAVGAVLRTRIARHLGLCGHGSRRPARHRPTYLP